MKKLVRVVMLVMVCLEAEAAYADHSATTIVNSFPKYEYRSKTYYSIREIDFKNFKLAVDVSADSNVSWAAFREGHFLAKDKDGTGYQEFGLESIRYFGYEKGSPRYVLVRFWEVDAGGSSDSFDNAQILTLNSDGHLILMQQIYCYTRNSENGGVKFYPRKMRLVVTATHDWEHCCPTSEDVITYRWDGSAFRAIALRSVPLRFSH